MVSTCASLEYLFSLKSDLKMHNSLNFAINSMSKTVTKTKKSHIVMLGQSCNV